MLGSERLASGRHIRSLTALRGIAALIVVFYHCLSVLPGFDGVRFAAPSGIAQLIVNAMALTPLRLLWSGREAVTLFFVLSGFVLTLPFADNRQLAYGSFVLRRVCRIYLPYIAAVATALALRQLVDLRHPAGASSWVDGFWAAPVTTGTLVDHLLMLGTGRANTLDPPIWSLVVEMRVSLLLPLLVAASVRFGAMRMICAVYLVYFPLRIGAGLLDVDREGLMSSAIETVGNVPMFLIGIGLALNVDRISRFLEACRTSGIILLAVGGALLIWIDPGIYKPHFRDFLTGPGSALLIIACLDRRGLASLLNIRPLRWLGDISYSLYLVHLPLLATAIYGIRTVSVPILAAVLPLFAIAAAAFFHRAIERPAMELGRNLTATNRQPGAGAGG
jgi:peptidoglycan/LPS O-acetylase OafA/YrhL